MNAMTEKPIIFSAPMVRALLAGRKLQTRRLLKLPRCGSLCVEYGRPYVQEKDGVYRAVKAPYAVGARLWVREAWRTFVSLDEVAPSDLLAPGRGAGIAYEAGGSLSIGKGDDRGRHYSAEPREDMKAFGRLRPSIHMPKFASRLTLTVTEARVQRLQDISEEDARAEGIEWIAPTYGVSGIASTWGETAGHAYSALWKHLHGPGSWDGNPWVAAYTFSSALLPGITPSAAHVRAPNPAAARDRP